MLESLECQEVLRAGGAQHAGLQPLLMIHTAKNTGDGTSLPHQPHINILPCLFCYYRSLLPLFQSAPHPLNIVHYHIVFVLYQYPTCKDAPSSGIVQPRPAAPDVGRNPLLHPPGS